MLLLQTLYVTNNLLMTADTGSSSLLILLNLTAAFETMDTTSFRPTEAGMVERVVQ